jgi:tetratricopeptide (TPR) repeat protein
MFERALALDPGSVEAKSALAITLANRVTDQMTSSATTDISRAEGLVAEAVAASPRSALAHFAKAEVLGARGHYDEAIPEYERVLAIDPNMVGALNALSQCKLLTGAVEQAIPLEEKAIRLSPRHPQIAFWYARIGFVHLLQSRTDEAIPWLEKARAANPDWAGAHAELASAYALKGNYERAAVELAEARRLSGDGRYSSIARLKTIQNFGVPTIRVLFEATYLDGLRKAGVPDA